MNPNHYLAVAINYLFQHRPQWGKDVAVGKTLVSSAMIDRVVNDLGRKQTPDRTYHAVPAGPPSHTRRSSPYGSHRLYRGA
ncbi:hypothetical protein [Escherichia coli]|uniref:hypothetical protein n=1 Tax=Escherichia coli TaxID=562 RepID=UPI003D9AB0C2